MDILHFALKESIGQRGRKLKNDLTGRLVDGHIPALGKPITGHVGLASTNLTMFL